MGGRTFPPIGTTSDRAKMGDCFLEKSEVIAEQQCTLQSRPWGIVLENNSLVRRRQNNASVIPSLWSDAWVDDLFRRIGLTEQVPSLLDA